MGTPNLYVITCGGRPGKLGEFENSVGYLTTPTRFITISMYWCVVVVSSGISFSMVFGCQYSLCTEPLKISIIFWKVDL